MSPILGCTHIPQLSWVASFESEQYTVGKVRVSAFQRHLAHVLGQPCAKVMPCEYINCILLMLWVNCAQKLCHVSALKYRTHSKPHAPEGSGLGSSATGAAMHLKGFRGMRSHPPRRLVAQYARPVVGRARDLVAIGRNLSVQRSTACLTV